MTTLLLVDVGNTSVKWWLEREQKLLAEGRCVSTPEALAESLRASEVSADSVALASVAAPETDQDFAKVVVGQTGAEIYLCRAEHHDLGLTNSYREPSTMGVDRWLGMIAAWRAGAGAVCVLDVGTAVTLDLVAADGRHEGGYILPGPRLMQESLTARTSRIDVGASGTAVVKPGTSTRDCVAAGAWLATAGAVREITRRYPDHRLIACGGDAQALLSLGFNAEYRPELIREGLSRWLRFQLSQH